MTAALQKILISKKLKGKTRSMQLAEDKIRGSRTKQEFKDDANLNVLMQKYGMQKANPQQLAAFAQHFGGMGLGGDATDDRGLADLLNTVNAATDAFRSLPSDIRDRFANDPTKLDAFLRNPDNQEEAYRLGLAVRPPEPVEPAPMRVRVVQTDLVDEAAKGPEGPKNTPKGGA